MDCRVIMGGTLFFCIFGVLFYRYSTLGQCYTVTTVLIIHYCQYLPKKIAKFLTWHYAVTQLCLQPWTSNQGCR